MLSGRDEALAALNRRVSELADLLALERSENEDLNRTAAQLSLALKDATATEIDLRQELNALLDIQEGLEKAQAQASTFEAEREELQTRLAELLAAASAARVRLLQTEEELESERDLSEAAKAQATLLNRQIADLRARLAQIAAALDASEKAAEEKDIQIIQLGNRLNAALATRVGELARYRSEFFGRLREILGDRTDVRIVGDRFVFQSEVLFESGSSEIGPEGQNEIANLSRILSEVAARIPADVPWILQIQGHTDINPIFTDEFPSNWELSTARANSVAHLLRENGILPSRLSVAGFAEFQPLVEGTDVEALRRNRRIELKLTQP